MEVVHLTRDHPPRINGGLSTAVGGLVRALRDAGAKQRVVSFDAWRPRRSAGTAPPQRENTDHVAVLRVRGPHHLDAARAFIERPALLHVHDGFLDDLAAEIDAPSVLTVHVAQGELRRLRGLPEPTRSERAQVAAAERAAAITIPSEGVRDALPSSLRPLATVLPLGVHDDMRARRAAALSRDEPRVLYAGRFADVKGTAELFDIIEATHQRVPAARFTVAGGLVDNPKSEAKWRRQLDERLSAGARAATEVTGWLDPDALAEAYARACVLVVPSWYETFGLSAIEAMLHGVAVVATDTPGLRAVVDEGLVVSAAAIPDALVPLLIDPARAASRGRAAAAHARAHHLWPRRVEGYLALYRHLATGRG